jgi:hypothetical protein
MSYYVGNPCHVLRAVLSAKLLPNLFLQKKIYNADDTLLCILKIFLVGADIES